MTMLCFSFPLLVKCLSLQPYLVIIPTRNSGEMLFLYVLLQIHQPAPTHPLLQATYTGVRITVLGNIFFPSFLVKTKRKQPLSEFSRSRPQGEQQQTELFCTKNHNQNRRLQGQNLQWI